MHIRTISLTEKEKDTFSMALHALDIVHIKLLKKGSIDKKYFYKVLEGIKSLNNKVLL